MIELFQESFEPYNLPFTILLFAVAGYWIIGLLGLVDIDGIGGAEGVDGIDGIDGIDGVEGIEGGADADASGTIGDDGGSHGHLGSAFFNGMLKMIGASDAPIIFVLSLFSLLLWAMNVSGNYYFNPTESASVATIILAPVVIGAFVLTRLLVRPLRPLTRLLKDSEKDITIVGASGVVRSSMLGSDDFGQIESVIGDRTLLLRARLSELADPLPKGSSVLVVSHDKENEGYIVRPLN